VKRSLIAGLVLVLTSCVSSPDPEVGIPLDASEDTPYYTVYQKVSADYEVIDNFSTKHQVHITHLTSEFRSALAQRYESVFNEPQPLLGEASQQTGFFVSLFAANNNLIDLSDTQVWNVQLETGGQSLKPSAIKHLKPKERWMPFFPSINVWSREYLVLFDLTPDQNPGSSKQGLRLVLSSPEGSVRSEW
jgi:hypothetical protein